MRPITAQKNRPNEVPPFPRIATLWEVDVNVLNGRSQYAAGTHEASTLRVHSQPRMGILDRFRRRNCVRWMLAYVALAWMALQMTDALREIWSWPIGLQKGITLVLALGTLPAAVVAWYHGEQGRQRVCLLELIILTMLFIGTGWVVLSVCG